MDINKEVLAAILDAYAYEIVFVDRQHIVRYMNKTAKIRYGARVQIGSSLFQCHNANSKTKIEAFLERADHGEDPGGPFRAGGDHIGGGHFPGKDRRRGEGISDRGVDRNPVQAGRLLKSSGGL